MKNGKSVFLSSALVVFGGVGLIFGNQVLASNVLTAVNKTEPVIIISGEVPATVMTERTSASSIYRNANGESYMALTNIDADMLKKQETQSIDKTDLSGTVQNPTDGKLSEEEAKHIGIKAIAEKFGLTQKEIGMFDVTIRGRYSLRLPSNIANMKPSMTAVTPEPLTDEGMDPSAEENVLIWVVMLTPPTIETYRAVFDDKSIEMMNVHAIPLIKEGMPLENEISSDMAKEIAITALTKKYALTQETLDRFTITIKYYEVIDEAPGKHVWWVNLYPTNVNEFSEIGCYWSYIDAETGEPLQLNSAVDGKG